jgi:hypothetical protein
MKKILKNINQQKTKNNNVLFPALIKATTYVYIKNNYKTSKTNNIKL